MADDDPSCSNSEAVPAHYKPVDNLTSTVAENGAAIST